MTDFILRKADQVDLINIKKLVRETKINPIGLDWRRFIIAETNGNIFAGCGQIKVHQQAVFELASIAVLPKYQGLGLGKKMIIHLLKTAPRPLYLTCREKLETFYHQFGFRVVEQSSNMPGYYSRLQRLARFFYKINLVDEKMLVMVLEN